MTPIKPILAASLFGLSTINLFPALAQTAPLPGLTQNTTLKSDSPPLAAPAVTTEAAPTVSSGGKSSASTSLVQQKPAVDAPGKNANRPHPKVYLSGCTQTFKRRSMRLLKDPCVMLFPIAHPLRASKYMEEHGISAALGLGTMAVSSVATVRK